MASRPKEENKYRGRFRKSEYFGIEMSRVVRDIKTQMTFVIWVDSGGGGGS